MRTAPAAALALLLAAGRALAGEPAPAPDKSGYHLFHPVPRDLLRPIDTDRPDKTNSPSTLDAGHVQLEVGLARFTGNFESGTRNFDGTWADVDLRVGLTNRAEVQIELPLYQTSRSTDPDTDATENQHGNGDLTVVAKINAWGNDSDGSAGGIELYALAPTAPSGLGEDDAQGGGVLLLAWPLPAGFEIGVNAGVGTAACASGRHCAEFVDSASLSRAIAGPLGAYLEFWSAVAPASADDWEGTVDVGSVITLGDDVQLDLGVNVGVTRGADDVEPFVGTSVRF